MENGFAHTDLDQYELLFDQHYHGRNIKITEGGKISQKIKKGAKEALVVTNRPLATNELFEVEIGGCNKFKGVKNEMKSVLKGKELIRIGVTAHCPSDVVSLSAQHSMKRMDSGTWMMMSDSIIESGEVVMAFTKYSLKEIVIGDRVGIVRLPEFNGSLVIYINGAPLGIVATAVTENVYGFVEMQGECESMCISQKKTLKQEALPIEIRAMREKQMEIKHFKKELEEKEELIETLQGQMEQLRKQVIMMKTHQGYHSSSKMEIKQDTETQTTPSIDSSRHSQSRSPSSSRGRSKKGCCVIS